MKMTRKYYAGYNAWGIQHDYAPSYDSKWSVAVFVSKYDRDRWVRGDTHPLGHNTRIAITCDVAKRIVGDWCSKRGNSIYNKDGYFVGYWLDVVPASY